MTYCVFLLMGGLLQHSSFLRLTDTDDVLYVLTNERSASALIIPCDLRTQMTYCCVLTHERSASTIIIPCDLRTQMTYCCVFTRGGLLHHSSFLRPTDPDDVICAFSAFGAWFRTPGTLLLRIRSICGVFYANSGYAVR